MLSTIVILFFVLLLLGTPISLILLSLSIFYVLFEPAIMDLAFAQRVVMGTQSFPLLAVPLFILTGELLNISGITLRVMGFAKRVTRRMRGGLAQTNILLSTLLAGMSGSANGDAAMQAKTLVPSMIRHGYPPPFASVVTAVSALIAPMIPPGIGLILFGFVTNTSIGQLFAGAVMPGLLLAAGLMVHTHFKVGKEGWDPAEEGPAKEPLLPSFLAALPALILPLLIILGIRFGVFTPTEAAAVAVLYTIVFMLVYREASLKEVVQALRSTVSTTAAIMLVLAASAAFSWILTFERVPQAIGTTLLGITDSPAAALALVSLLLFVAGMFIEGTALILVLAPMFLGPLTSLGVDPVQYGIVFVLMVHLGGVTPPVGTVMFTVCSIARVPLSAFAREVGPYIGTYLVVAGLLILVPWLSTLLAYL